ncbi:MAG TPA: antitoxin MazE family protein [Stellaceae bacterium]|nr:antitoxin MazE family protein [Stellaceae bacterium]
METVTPRSARAEDGLDKFRRYRATRRARGMKLLRIWVPDPHAPGFREEAHRQALLLRDAPEEREALDFIEAAADLGDAEQ